MMTKATPGPSKPPSKIGAQGVFLDRIRYPSPANGLEYLGACSCSACTKAFYRDNGMDWPDLVREMVNWAAYGREGAVKFRDAHKPAREFRAKMVATAVSRYSEAVHGAGLRVGLDLLAPALSDIVGQDYALLSRNADFIKPMLYCKASAPAGLPLEFRLLMEGLSRSGVETSRARQFVAELSGIEDEHLKAVQLGGSFPASLAASQMSRAKREADGRNDHRADVYAGIELVDHEVMRRDQRGGPGRVSRSIVPGKYRPVLEYPLYSPKPHNGCREASQGFPMIEYSLQRSGAKKDLAVKPPLLRMENISKSFLGVKVLIGSSLPGSAPRGWLFAGLTARENQR